MTRIEYRTRPQQTPNDGGDAPSSSDDSAPDLSSRGTAVDLKLLEEVKSNSFRRLVIEVMSRTNEQVCSRRLLDINVFVPSLVP